MTPFFSIIMPVYNVEAALPASLASVLAQDDRDFEVILVDDGATDRSGQICDECAAQYDFVRVIHKPNGGLSSARNAGLAQARGQYVVMPDSDDTVEPNTLSVVRGAIEDAARQSGLPVDIIKFSYQRHVGDRIINSTVNVPVGLYTEDGASKLLDSILLEPRGFPLSAWSHAYRRAFLEENQLAFVSERQVLSEDFLFNVCAFMAAKSVYVTDKPLYHYICREGSLTRTIRKDMAGKYALLYDHVLAFAARHGVDDTLYRKIATYYINHLIYGNCIVYEYRVYPGHTWEDGRRNVKNILKIKSVKTASGKVYFPSLKPKHILRILCIHLGLEPVLAFTMREWKNIEYTGDEEK